MSVATSGMTENEQKQQLSVAYVHAVAARAGYACQVINVDDDSVDVQLAARGFVHERAVLRSPKIDIQLKATSRPVRGNHHLAFPLPRKNYDELRGEFLVPRILVVLLLPEAETDWLVQSEEELIIKHCAYWATLRDYPTSDNSSTVTIRLPREQQFTVSNLRAMMVKVAGKEAP